MAKTDPGKVVAMKVLFRPRCQVKVKRPTRSNDDDDDGSWFKGAGGSADEVREAKAMNVNERT